MDTHYKRHKKFPFNPRKAALLVIDVQNYFTDSKSHACIPTAPEIVPKVKSLTNAFHKIERPVIFTRHIDIDMDNLMNRWWQDSIRKNDLQSEINDNFDTSYGKIIEKHQYDAFLKTDLDKMLRESNTSQVVITGVVTHLCCETTARSAFMHNYETFFVTDATTSYELRHHEAAIFNLAHGFAIPVKTEDLLCTIQS